MFLILFIRGDIIKNYIKIGIGCLLFVILLTVFFINRNNDVGELTGVVVKKDAKSLSVKNDKDVIYTFGIEDESLNVGDNVVITYSGLLDSNREKQKVKLIECLAVPASYDYSDFSLDKNNDIFGKYYSLAEKLLKSMSLDEKIGQLLLVRYGDNYQSAIKDYHVGGFVFFEKDFKDKDRESVIKMINDSQKMAKIPLLTSVDEEGGDVVRVSSNPKLRSSKFKSPSELYTEGGLDLIATDTKEKSKLLSDLGLNVNLAPVLDVSSSSSYMYPRTLKEDTSVTSDYARIVIKNSKNSDVSYVLKHFPGYGDNVDTHNGESIDGRSLEEIMENDIPPFTSAIDEGAEAILVSHNTVNSVDSSNPASLSYPIHLLLRDDLNFSGIIMTDDLSMGATADIPNAYSTAFEAGNDIVMVTDYEKAFNDIKNSIDEGDISNERLDEAVTRILAWKYYKGIMFNTK